MPAKNRRPERRPALNRELNRGALGLVCELSVNSLIRADGRASGIKFNKLVCEVHEILSHAEDRAFHFALPRRWYMYGEVVDASQLWDIVRFHSVDDNDEIGTNVDIVPGGPRSHPPGFEEEVVRIVRNFVAQYPGTEGIEPMLRHHYERAPYPFQQGFLDWYQLTRGILGGYKQDDPEMLTKAFSRLEDRYPVELDDRLTTAFNRLTLFLGPHVDGRRFGDFAELRHQELALWDFWSTFCLFLSVRYNADEPRERIEFFQGRAEREITAYQRRLVALLENEYLKDSTAGKALFVPSSELASALVDDIMRALTDGF